MTTITKRFEFDAGHRVMGHEGKCRSMHGHRYAVEFSLTAPGLDALGRVVDFDVLKRLLGDYLDEMFDHAFIVWDQDKEVIDALARVPRQKIAIIKANPTAENLALMLFRNAGVVLAGIPGVSVTRVVVFETPTSRAEVHDAVV